MLIKSNYMLDNVELETFPHETLLQYTVFMDILIFHVFIKIHVFVVS